MEAEPGHVFDFRLLCADRMRRIFSLLGSSDEKERDTTCRSTKLVFS